ncbi:family 43 glycosylhydrolase [Ruminococcus flavefaciens]|uniref:family 43 glycosylhydrolase n=1 Tax=Ruminococcus flavefaciens TaxID=1265 RepID=UPI0026EC940A|nr:family 43 glycosylhydrolase [Ruminococcus flavefaciens]MDD7516870.1 family 43 glycosylhydrolase [Ruminococcus flavefaciens]MDY5690909.1 family 43 glycosylhydrolase [Ruminococcus flavefaciens]
MERSKRLIALSCCAALAFSACPVTAKAMVTADCADEYGEVISGGDYNIMVRLSGKFVTAGSDGNVQQWEKKGDSSQIWHIESAGDGKCCILSGTDRRMALTVENGDNTNGNNIYLSEYRDTAAQHFILHRTDDAYYITGECSGNAALDVYDISHENGANIDQWDHWAGEGQKFYIRPVGGEYSFIRGDLNFDSAVDIFDRVIMQRGIINGFDETMSVIADADGNGMVNTADLVLLSGFIAGKDVTMSSYSTIKNEKPEVAYLFAYFLGNAPEQERLSYAVSTDGYNFKALNGGGAVWKSSVGTEFLRDPYIFKGEDGLYYMLATDMKSSLGWNSNRNLLSAKSTDLVHWFDETSIEIANKYSNMQGADRAWAPQAIYDPEKESYMIYFAARVPNRDNRTIMYYAYSKDLKKLDTEPQLLFAPKNGNDAIDSDIIHVGNKYYMYYKNETNKRIYLATADHASGPYSEIKQVSEGNIGVEGPNIYKLIGEDKWLMMSDAYGDGYYVMQETKDLENFTTVSRNSYSFNFTPRHGYVIPINADQYTALINAFPSAGLTPLNTGVKPVSVNVGIGERLQMPDTVTLQYTGGGKADVSVEWDNTAIDTSKPGNYTVKGKIRSSSELYDNPFIKERADPYIVDGENGYYYFTASYPAYGSVDKGYDRIILRRSNTVGGLASAEEKTIWKAHSSGILSKHIWAPEMHKIGGSWYMFFAAGASDNIWAIRPYVLKCDGEPFTGNWTECGQMQASSGDSESFKGFSLDMTYFENNGRHYVIWAEIKGDSSLFMAEIDPSQPWKLISKPIMLTKPEYNWEKVNNRVNEGAAVLKTDKKIYVFFSASGTGSEYCVGRLQADINSNLMDISSWTKLREPVLQTADLKDQSGPGHNCFVRNEKGDLLIVYHARPANHASQGCGTYNKDPLYDPCRHTRIKRVCFDGNGDPIINLSDEAEVSPVNKEIKAVVTVG